MVRCAQLSDCVALELFGFQSWHVEHLALEAQGLVHGLLEARVVIVPRGFVGEGTLRHQALLE